MTGNWPIHADINIHPTTVDVELDGGETFSIGKAHFQVFATPGHTPGSVCYLMERHGYRVLFSGDVIISLDGAAKSVTLFQGPFGTYSAHQDPRYRGDARAFLATLRSLRSLPAPDLVLPGHPRMDHVPQNPAMTQERWQDLIDSGIAKMEALNAHYDRTAPVFLDDTPKALLPNLYLFGEFKKALVFGFIASSKLFIVDAPGGPGLLEFVNARLRQLGLAPLPPAAILLTGCAEETAGLTEIVEKTGAQVVVASQFWPNIKAKCPSGTVLLRPEELAAKGWVPMQTMRLQGRGLGSCAYRLAWEKKTCCSLDGYQSAMTRRYTRPCGENSRRPRSMWRTTPPRWMCSAWRGPIYGCPSALREGRTPSFTKGTGRKSLPIIGTNCPSLAFPIHSANSE